MSALSRVPKLTRPAPERRSKATPTADARAHRSRLSTGDDERLTEPGPKGDNRVRSENARKWLAAGSLDRDADDIAATVDRLVSALDSRDWMTPPNTPSKPVRAASGPMEPAGARASTDDLAFAEGADFREVARRIAEFRQARPDPAGAGRRAAPGVGLDAPAPSRPSRPDPVAETAPAAPRPGGTRSASEQRRTQWDADWRPFPDEGSPTGALAEAPAPSVATGAAEDAPIPTRMRPLTRDDWPAPGATDGAAATGSAPSSEAPAPSNASLRQRLAALRARSMSETAQAQPEPAPAPPAAPARKPLDTSDAFAKAMLAQFEAGDWLNDDETDAPDATRYDTEIELAEVAPDPQAPALDDDQIETWAAADASEQQVSNESLLAALDAHLAADDPFDAAADAPEDAAPDDGRAWPPVSDGTGDIAPTEAAADRRLALEAARRAEDLATTTGRRIDDLVDRLGRLEAQDLPSRFTTLAERFDRIDARLAEIATPAPPIDFATVTAPMQAMEARVARLEAASADQYASLTAMISTVANRVAGAPETAKRLAAIEHHVQEIARRLEAHEVNVRAMKALAEALDRLEARLGRPRPPAPDVSVPTAPRHPAAEAMPRTSAHAAPAAPRAQPTPDQAPSQGHAMSEREAILERYRRQSRGRTEFQG